MQLHEVEGMGLSKNVLDVNGPNHILTLCKGPFLIQVTVTISESVLW